MSLLAPPITYDRFLRTPESNQHIEVVDGHVIAHDPPVGSHQRAILRLGGVLDAAAPAGYEAVVSPYDWILRRDPLLVRQPDVLVMPSDEVEGGKLNRAPLLAVEVLSDSSVERDTVTKPREYAEAGLAHLWVVDPRDARRAEIVVLRLAGGRYVEAARAVGAEPLELTEPFPVALRPADLTTRR